MSQVMLITKPTQEKPCGARYMKKLFWDTVFMEGVRTKQYLILLNDVYVDEIPLAVRRRFYFQQDGAPRNFAGGVRSWLDEILLRR